MDSVTGCVKQGQGQVESILSLSEVAMSVLGEVEGVVSTPEGPLEVAQEGIDRAKLGQSDAAPLNGGAA